MSSRVALVRCDDYDPDRVYAAVGRGLELLGGAERFVSAPGERILLKPNLLVGSAPDQAVTTRPAVFAAVARHLQAVGAHLAYGDSPAFGSIEGVARRAGIAQAAEELGVPLADFRDGREVPFPAGDLIRTWFLANGALDAGGIVSLPKMKAHALTRITGAVKNQFGCVPGIRKGEFHARMDEVDRFCRMLVDLSRVLPARLHVMDGVVAMEGNGPRNGDPRPMGVLLLSSDPVAMDATVCRLIGLDVSLVGTCTHGEASGLGTATDIKLVGDPVEEFVAHDFVVNRSSASTTGRPSRFSWFMRRWVVAKPVMVPARCTACGTCVEVCPVEPKAVDWAAGEDAAAGRPPAYEYSRCIRCYCCQEMCPERAITVEVPPLGRLLRG